MNTPTNTTTPLTDQVNGANSHQQEGAVTVSHNHSLAEANLRLAADTMERTGWTVARLIAASVQVGVGHGGDRTSKIARGNLAHEKLGLVAAAETMSKSAHTIKAYLAAWNSAAADGLCVPSSDLTPEDGATANLPDAEWSDYYTNTKPRGVGIGQVEQRAAEDPEYRNRLAEVVAPERTPAATLNEWAGSERQMKGILSGTTGSGRAARRFISEAIKADPAVAAAADQALEDRTREQAPPARKDSPETNRDRHQYELSALMQARKIRRESKALASMVHDLDGATRETVASTITEAIDALDIVRASLHGEESMDAALAALLDGEA